VLQQKTQAENHRITTKPPPNHRITTTTAQPPNQPPPRRDRQAQPPNQPPPRRGKKPTPFLPSTETHAVPPFNRNPRRFSLQRNPRRSSLHRNPRVPPFDRNPRRFVQPPRFQPASPRRFGGEIQREERKREEEREKVG
jgi:hypothetical protein